MRTDIEIADDIIKLAMARIEKGAPYQNLNSAIHAVKLDITIHLMSIMKYQKKKKRGNNAILSNNGL
uniref:Uncharacterized protein n=1 Tax=viral metagenome TaxID=1070528 RepID=A0A6M3L599_9ZZZZ